MDTKLIKTVAMFGPSIREPWKIVNRNVPERDVQAYKAAGYKIGSVPEPEIAQPEPVVEITVAAESEPAAAVKPKGKGKGK